VRAVNLYAEQMIVGGMSAMSLKKIFPAKRLKGMFTDVSIINRGKKDWHELCDEKPHAMHEIGMTIWDLIVTRGTDDVDPMAMADSVTTADPQVAVKIKKLLQKPVMFDLYYGKASAEFNGKRETIAEVLAAHIYPNELHLADVEFRDPSKPIAKNKRRYPLTRFKGLGLLDSLMDSLESEANARECTSVTLTAATSDHVPLFKKYGFEVPDTPRGKLGEMFGLGIPMVKRIA
jgi:hypothetical protein